MSMFRKWLSKYFSLGGVQAAEVVANADAEITSGLAEIVTDLSSRLTAVEKMAAATQRKVYRDLAADPEKDEPVIADLPRPQYKSPYHASEVRS